jgi:hypothetical protein
MRHLIIGALAVAAALALAFDSKAHTLTSRQRGIEIAVVIGVFFLVDLAIGFAVRPAKKGRQASSSSSPYASPGKRR